MTDTMTCPICGGPNGGPTESDDLDRCEECSPGHGPTCDCLRCECDRAAAWDDYLAAWDAYFAVASNPALVADAWRTYVAAARAWAAQEAVQ